MIIDAPAVRLEALTAAIRQRCGRETDPNRIAVVLRGPGGVFVDLLGTSVNYETALVAGRVAARQHGVSLLTSSRRDVLADVHANGCPPMTADTRPIGVILDDVVISVWRISSGRITHWAVSWQGRPMLEGTTAQASEPLWLVISRAAMLAARSPRLADQPQVLLRLRELSAAALA